MKKEWLNHEKDRTKQVLKFGVAHRAAFRIPQFP